MARRQVVTRPGKKIDFKSWSSLLSVVQSISSDSTVLGSSLAFAIPATILRCRGQIAVGMDESKQVNDTCKLAFGLAMISTDAFAAGAGSVPDPAGEADFPWLWWYEVHLNNFVAAASESGGLYQVRIELDSKAMRKVKPGESLAFITQYVDITGAPIVDLLQSQIRVLIGT